LLFESLGFTCAYTCSIGTLGGDLVRKFGSRATGPWGGGLGIRVLAEKGLPWSGEFEYDAGSLEKVCATPSPSRVMVIARGEGYIVKVDNPDNWEYVAVAPVLDVRRVPDRDILICTDYQDLVAYGKSGLVWALEYLGLDDVEILKVLRNEIQGSARHEALGTVPFSVDPSTGHVNGGSGFVRLLSPPWRDHQGADQLPAWSG